MKPYLEYRNLIGSKMRAGVLSEGRRPTFAHDDALDERLLQFAWYEGYFDHRNLRTESGKRLEIIHAGRWNPDQHNWYVNSPPTIIAHEIGHMIGAYDEYRGGALSPDQPLIDTNSIMGSRAEKGVAIPRHLDLVKKMLAEQLGDVEIRTRLTE